MKFSFNFKKKILFRLALVVLLGPLLLGGWLAVYSLQPGPGPVAEDAIVVIPPGTGLQQISKILAEAGLIHEDIRFLLLARYLGLSAKLPAGEFSLTMGKTPGDVLRQLATANAVRYAVIIPEGLRIEEVAAIFAAGAWCDRQNFIALAHNPDFIESLGLKDVPSLEGYLYPDTYFLTREQLGAEFLITLQVERFKKIWSGLAVDPVFPLSRHEVVTLASIIEKETGAAAERPVIAAVFLNRLKTRMRLQSDPTVIYGLVDFSGNLTRTNLKTEHPYNTYVIPALPVGPICNPGHKAIEAVLRPAATDFIYFVSRNDGTHQFSRNLTEHNQAVQQYQRRPRAAAN